MTDKYLTEPVRVKVKKCEQNLKHEWRKFYCDPQITTLEILKSLLSQAFNITTKFSIKYKAFDPAGNEIYVSVLSDWDLHAAFLRIYNISIHTSSEPYLMLQIDVESSTSNNSDVLESKQTFSNRITQNSPDNSMPLTGNSRRDIIFPLNSFGMSQKYVQQMQHMPGMIINQMEKTLLIVQKAFNLSEDTIINLPERSPLSDSEFRHFMDPLGEIQRNEELHNVIFLAGIEPSLRRVVWKHLLNVYPKGMNGHQRMDFIRKKSADYFKLRDIWKNGEIIDKLSYITNMVKKDVLRTDRLHPFYAGSDDNDNIASLFNILTTYALNHPSVSYCQGMSDIASPLLVTMNDEAQAYICFCAIMTRLKSNFMTDGNAITKKFFHLTLALNYYDPEFWKYLKSQQAHDLLFCYRWLLLELKREFPFEDALRMLEVQWSALQPENNISMELQLIEKNLEVLTDESVEIRKPCQRFPTMKHSTDKLENSSKQVCTLHERNKNASRSSSQMERIEIITENASSSIGIKQMEEHKNREINVIENIFEVSSQSLFQFHDTNPFKNDDILKSQYLSEFPCVVKNTFSSNDIQKVMTNKCITSKANVNIKQNTFSRINGEVLLDDLHKSKINLESLVDVNSDIQESEMNGPRNCDLGIEPSSLTLDSLIIQSEPPELNSKENCVKNFLNSTPDCSIDISSEIWADSYVSIDQNQRKLSSISYSTFLNDENNKEQSKTINSSRVGSEENIFKNDSLVQNELLIVNNGTVELVNRNPFTDNIELDHSSAIFEDTSYISSKSDMESLRVELDLKVDGETAFTSQNSNEFIRSTSQLPPPSEFGGGNAFLMFLCLSLLLQQRNTIIEGRMDYNEIAMLFDKMVRKHDLNRVLSQARLMYVEYLKLHGAQNNENKEVQLD